MVTIFRYVSGIFLACLIGIAPQMTTYAMVNDMFEKEAEPLEEDNRVSNQPVDNELENETSAEAPNFLSSLVKLIVFLGLIIGLIVLISKFLQKRNGFLNRQQIIENYGGLNVGSNKSIRTIKIADRFFVVGVGENIELLMEITDQKTIDRITEQNEANQALVHNMKKKFIKNHNDSQEVKQEQPKQDFETLFNKELHSMKENRKKLSKKILERQRSNDH